MTTLNPPKATDQRVRIAAPHNGPDNDPDNDPNTAGPSSGDPGPVALDEGHHPSPKQSSLRAADPSNPTRRDTASAARVFVVMMGALVLGAALNSESMVEQVSAHEFGTVRDARLAVWEPLASTSNRIHLNWPRRTLDRLIDGQADQPEAEDRPFVLAATDPTSTPLTIGSQLSRHPEVAGPTKSAQDDANPSTSRPSSDQAQAQGSLARTELHEPTTGQRLPSSVEPLRLFIAGDSTMDAVGAALLQELASSDKVTAELDYRISSGLSRPDFFDWPQYLDQVTTGLGIETVIIMLGANDAQPFLVEDQPVNYGTDLWFETYRTRVANLMDQMAAKGVTMVWVGQAVMKDRDLDDKMVTLNTIFAEEAARRSDSVIYIDPRPLMSDGGEFASYLTDSSGGQQQVRRNDGVHFTPAGGERLAPLIIEGLTKMVPLAD